MSRASRARARGRPSAIASGIATLGTFVARSPNVNDAEKKLSVLQHLLNLLTTEARARSATRAAGRG